MDQNNIDALIKKALQARENAYVPYSKFKVGAAVLHEDGEVYVGCNIENASYGLSMCAERTAIFKAVSAGKKNIIAIAIVGDVPRGVCMPCGACRQVISEFMKKEGLVICSNLKGIYELFSVEQMLPYGFSKDDLIMKEDEGSKNTNFPTI